MFNCPKCESRKSFVVDTRMTNKVIRRRRKCADCSHRWTTYESSIDFASVLASTRSMTRTLNELRKRARHLEAQVLESVERMDGK